LKPVNDCRCWAVAGQCQSNPKFMKKQCSASCSWHNERENAVQSLAAVSSQPQQPQCDLTAANKSHALQVLVDNLEMKLAVQKEAAESTAMGLRIVELEVAHKLLKAELDGTRSALGRKLFAENKSLASEAPGAGSSERRATECRASELEAERKMRKEKQTHIEGLEARIAGLVAEMDQKATGLAAEARNVDLEVERKKAQADIETARAAVRAAVSKSQDCESRIVELKEQLHRNDSAKELAAMSTKKWLEEQLERAKVGERSYMSKSKELLDRISQLEAAQSPQVSLNEAGQNASCSAHKRSRRAFG